MSSQQEAGREEGTAADTAEKYRNAPPPEDRRKPKTPTKLHAGSWKYIFKRSIREFSRNKCTDRAAGLTYFAMLSLFPALLAVVSLLGVVGQAQSTTQTIMEMVEGVASDEVVETIRPTVEQLASSPAAGFALIAGLLGALWSASGYVGAFGRSINDIYDVQEGRPFYKLKPIMLLVTLVMLVAVSVMGVLLVLSGPFAQAVGEAVGLGEAGILAWNIAKWPVMALFAIGLIAVLYYGTPNVKQPKFRWISLGSCIALIVLAVATLGFFFYVANFGNYNKTYGTIGGVIVLLLWIWISNLSLLFGAVFDAETERARELQGGIEAERSVQLPPRDVKASDKLLEKEEQDVREGRELRVRAALAEEQEGDKDDSGPKHHGS